MNKRAKPPAVPVDQLSVRKLIETFDAASKGARHVDIAHAMLTMVGSAVAMNAPNLEAAKRNGRTVARDLETHIRDEWKQRRKAGAPAP